jgi:Secretion system C-terminal sorting domain
MVQQMYNPAHHTTSLQDFLRYSVSPVFLLLLFAIPTLPAQDITGVEVVRTLQHVGNYSVGTIDSYFDSTHQLIAYSIGDGTQKKDTLVIYDFGQDLILAKIPNFGLLSGISFIDAGSLLYVTKDTLWQVTGIGENITKEALETGIRSMRLSNDLTTLALVLYHNGISSIGMAAYDTATGALLTMDTIGSGEFSIDEYLWLAFSPGDDYFALNGGYDHPYIFIIDVASKTLHQVATPDIESTYSPEFFTQDNSLKLAVGGGYYNGAITVVDVASLTQEGSMPAFAHYNYTLTFDQTRSYMACGGYDGELKLLAVADTLFSEVKSYDVGTLKKLHITRDNQYLLSGYQASAGARLDIQRIIREPSAVKVASSLPLRLYPNPTTGKILLDGIQEARVTIYDGGGKTLIDQKVSGDGLDISHLPPGLYLLRAENDEGTRIGRFVKE